MTKFTVRTLEKFDQECSRRTIIVDFIFIPRKARILAVLHESMQPCKNQVRLQSTNHLYSYVLYGAAPGSVAVNNQHNTLLLLYCIHLKLG